MPGHPTRHRTAPRAGRQMRLKGACMRGQGAGVMLDPELLMEGGYSGVMILLR